MNPTDILTPHSAAQLVADSAVELLMPFVGMLLVVVMVFMFKDFAMKFGKGLAFSLNKQFKEGDRVIIDDERAIIVKIGLTQTVFGISKVHGDLDGDYVWRYVPNERISFLKIEKIIFDVQPALNHVMITRNTNDIENLKGSEDNGEETTGR